MHRWLASCRRTTGRLACVMLVCCIVVVTLALPGAPVVAQPADGVTAGEGAQDSHVASATTDPVAPTDRIIITREPGHVTGADLSATTLRTGTLRPLPGFPDHAVIDLPPGLTVAQADQLVDELLRDPSVRDVEPDPAIVVQRVPNDPLWQNQWGPMQRGLPSAWATTTGARTSPVVAVLDTGVTETSELEGRVLPGFDVLRGGSDTADMHGHGTLTATVLAGRGENGIGFAGQCWDCRVLPIKVLDDQGSGRVSDLAVGIRWAVDNGAQLINVSAGGPSTNSVLDEALDYAEQHDVAVIASAGNGGQELALYPAAHASVLSVAGSNEVGAPYGWTNRGQTVDVAAPGCNVAQQTDGSFTDFCGTSSAAPFVTGLLALALDVQPDLDPQELRARTSATATTVSWVRWGIVNAALVPADPGEGASPLPLRLSVTNGDLEVTLTWLSEEDLAATTRSYEVMRSEDGQCNEDSLLLTSTEGQQHLDRDVVHGGLYTYCVYAMDLDGRRSERSNDVSVGVVDRTPPPAPVLTSGMPADRAADLTWTASEDPTGPVTYRLHRSTGGSCTATSPVVWSGVERSTSQEDLRNTTTYRYCVTATDAAGNSSQASTHVAVTPQARASDRCTPITGDWDGSGSTGVGWWCDGRVRLRLSDSSVIRYTYGRSGDVPIVADWNGDGRDTISVIRDGTWHLNNRLRGGSAESTFIYGRVARGDVPLAGSWFADGFDTPGIIRDREWHLRASQSGGAADLVFIYGRLTAGDQPLTGDWNGDGRDTVGIVRQGGWHLRMENTGGRADLTYRYGRVLSGDSPVTGDWTGDGRDTPGIVRDGVWMLKHDHRGGSADESIVFRSP